MSLLVALVLSSASSPIPLVAWQPIASQRSRRQVDLTVPLPPSAETPGDVQEAIEGALQVLLARPESYERDPSVGQVPADEFEAWQSGEGKRLADLYDPEGGQEWPYEGVYRLSTGIPAGYRVGGTAIVCTALATTPGYADSTASQAAVQRSIAFMLGELENNQLLQAGPKQGYDVRGWAHTYALDFFLLALRQAVVQEEAVVERVKQMIPHLIECLEANETEDGGWNYAGSGCSPFMTGSTLLALFQARADGFEVPAEMVTRALDGLERTRSENGAYAYAGGRKRGETAMPGACARSAIAELCLYRAGRSNAKHLAVAVDAFFEHWDELLKRKSQQGTHKGDYGIAPYYFFYGHTYAARAIEHLPEQQRPALRQKMHDVLWKTREPDGGWNDRIFPRTKSYSTAMALLSLIAPNVEEVPEWTEGKSDTPR